jgi:hypothetical protein
MSTKFLESFGGKLAEQWVAKLLTPAFVFWGGGVSIAIQHYGWKTIADRFKQQPDPLQVTILISSFFIIAASAFIVERFDSCILKFLKGYWPEWMNPLRNLFLKREIKRDEMVNTLCKDLAKIQRDVISPDHPKLIQAQWQQHYLPVRSEELRPTQLGNILHAMQCRPLEIYGLDAIVCWSRLWLLLPDNVKKEITEARADLNNMARTWLWSLLFAGWSIWGFWGVNWALLTLPLGLASALFAYRCAIAAAIVYSDLLEATFDLYRHLLYDALRWKLPNDPDEERRVGKQLTELLWRGEIVSK